MNTIETNEMLEMREQLASLKKRLENQEIVNEKMIREAMTEKGIKTSVEELIAQQNERDARDSGRDVAPLTPADDAVFLDNSQISLAETIDEVIRLAREKQLTAK